MNTIRPHNFAEWCIERHQVTNHYYDKYLPYEFHLRMVVKIFRDFKHLIPPEGVTGHQLVHGLHDFAEVCEAACWGHDLIEDTRTSYNDIVQRTGTEVAELIYALTNEKGRNRAERGGDKYYELIRATKGAVFVKLCDRIANVQYSKMSGSGMFEMYRREIAQFLIYMDYAPGHPLEPMFDYLLNLFV